MDPGKMTNHHDLTTGPCPGCTKDCSWINASPEEREAIPTDGTGPMVRHRCKELEILELKAELLAAQGVIGEVRKKLKTAEDKWQYADMWFYTHMEVLRAAGLEPQAQAMRKALRDPNYKAIGEE